MSENGTTFEEGFIAGWKSIMGTADGIPDIPEHSVPTETTPYLHGIAKGVEAAMERKEMEMMPPQSN